MANATQTGYALGLLFLVPLGDVLDQRRLITKLFALLTLAWALVAVSPTFAILVASAVAGLMASVTHVMLPIASEIATDGNRGRAIGTVMAGLVLGILLARTFAGWLGNLGGWRSVYVVAAVLNLCCAVVVGTKLPRTAERQRLAITK